MIDLNPLQTVASHDISSELSENTSAPYSSTHVNHFILPTINLDGSSTLTWSSFSYVVICQAIQPSRWGKGSISNTFTIYGLSNNIKLQPTFLCGAGKLYDWTEKKKYLNKNKIALNVIELKRPEDLEKKSAFLEVTFMCWYVMKVSNKHLVGSIAYSLFFSSVFSIFVLAFHLERNEYGQQWWLAQWVLFTFS